MSYRHATGTKLMGVERGVLADGIEFEEARAHGRQNVVVDARAYLVQRWRVDQQRAIAGGDPYAQFDTVSALRAISEMEIVQELDGLRGFTPTELEALRPYLTVHSSRDTTVGFSAQRRVIQVYTSEEKADRLRVLDASLIAIGSVVRIHQPGMEPEYAMVRGRNYGGIVTLDRQLQNEYEMDQATVSVELRHPININTADIRTLVAVFTGLRTWWDREPANASNQGGNSGRSGNAVSQEEAATLAALIHGYEDEYGHPIRQFQDFRELMDKAVADGVITERDKYSILLNARNPNDPRLISSTQPFIYRSHDIFTLETSAVINNLDGVPVATYRVREVVELSPPTQVARGFDSQYDFQRQVWRGLGYKVDSWPNYVELWERTGDLRYWPDMSADTGNQGTLRLGTGQIESSTDTNIGGGGRGNGRRRGRQRNYDHFTARRGILPTDQYGAFEVWPDGVGFQGQAITVQAQGQNIVLDPDNAERDIRAGQIEFWFKPQWEDRGSDHYLFDLGENADLFHQNRISLFYDSDNQQLVLRCADATLEATAAEVRYSIDSGRFQNDVWYHISGFWYGTNFGEMALMVDGQPVGTFEHRTADGQVRVTRLSDDIGAEEAFIPVDDTDGFPAEGVLIIGAEAIHYTALASGGFQFTPYEEFAQEPEPDENGDPNEPAAEPTLPLWMRTGRGARGTQATAHVAGSPVVVYGFTSEVLPAHPQTEVGIYQGGASVSEGGFGDNTFQVMVLPGTGGAGGGGAPGGGGGGGGGGGDSGVFLQAPPIPPALTADGDKFEVETTENFPDSGFLILFYEDTSGSADPGAGGGADPGGGGGGDSGVLLPQDPEPDSNPGQDGDDGNGGGAGGGGSSTFVYEFVYYSSKTDTEFENLQRGLYGTDAQEFLPGTGVYLVSVAADNPLPEQYAPGGWIQVDYEWFRYDQLDTMEGKWYFVKTVGVTDELGDSEPDEDDGSGGSGGGIPGGDRQGSGNGGTPGAGPGGDSGALLPQDQPKGDENPGQDGGGEGEGGGEEGPDAGSTDGKRDFTFRAEARTLLAAHEAGAKIIPIFRTERPVSGRFDETTILFRQPQSDTKEAAVVEWSFTVPEPTFDTIPMGSGSSGSSGGGSGGGIPGGTRQGEGGSGGGSPGGSNGDSGVLLPQDPGAPAAPAAPQGDPWHLVAFTDWVENQFMAEGTRLLKFPSGELPARIQPDIQIGADLGGKVTTGVIDELRLSAWGRRRMEVRGLIADLDEEATEIPLVQRVNGEGPGVVASGGGNQQPSPGANPGEPAPPPPNWIAPDLPDDGGLVKIGDEVIGYRTTRVEDGTVRWIEGAERGMLGTEAGPIPLGSTATFLYYIDVTTTTEGGDSAKSQIGATNVQGFASDGYIRIGDEILGYSRVDRQAGFIMPERAEDSQGLFRGAFGTEARSYDSGELIIGQPYRYYDRYAERADAPEMAHGAMLFAAKDAFWTRVTWDGELPDPAYHQIRVLVRVDGVPAWDAEPTNEPGGLYQFTDAMAQNVLNVQGDTVEVRVFFEYRPGAHERVGSGPDQYTRPGWKQSPILHQLRVEYREPVVIRHREELIR
ncbi:MAG: hypothetical protein ACYTGX_04715 [Planctomycetota bacterium]|jgi:hypothetical protein